MTKVDNVPELIAGSDLTKEQKKMLPFNGKSNPLWLECHSFYFINGSPASKDSGFYYPVTHSFDYIPH